MSLITATQLAKTFHRGQEAIHAVNGVDVTISQGEFVSFVGPSGSGKTTLLHLLGCLDTPSGGSLNVNGHPVFANGKSLSERELTRVRRRTFGYIFQKFYLIPTLTVQENILLPFAFNAGNVKRHDVSEIASLLGLEKRLKHLPSQISGGEMQRVAIARALVSDPKVILADEPTGNLDSKRSDEIAGILSQLNQDKGITIILVTHNPSLAEKASRVISLVDGKITKET